MERGKERCVWGYGDLRDQNSVSEVAERKLEDTKAWGWAGVTVLYLLS